MGLLTVAHSLGMLFGALLAGLMMDWYNLRGAFSLGALVMAAGLVAFCMAVSGTRVDARRVTQLPPPMVE
jgi:MFS family permease